MTDPEFYAAVDELLAHTTARREESLKAADVEEFKRWDRTFNKLETIRLEPMIDRLGRGGD